MSKGPDFSRHPQVEPEEVVSPPIKITIVEDRFDKAYRESKQTIEEKPLWIDLYLKVGLYCGWSWEEFKSTPYAVIKYINEDINKKLKKAMSPGNFVSWEQLFVSIAIARAMGGGKSSGD